LNKILAMTRRKYRQLRGHNSRRRAVQLYPKTCRPITVALANSRQRLLERATAPGRLDNITSIADPEYLSLRMSGVKHCFLN
jgi:hypothetical protein